MTSSFDVFFSLLACGLCQAQTELASTSEDPLEKPFWTESGMIAGAVRAQGRYRLSIPVNPWWSRARPPGPTGAS
jgi:hypothetical protein